MNDDPPALGPLIDRANEAQFEFLQSDLELCLTFVDIADTERYIGDPKGVQQAREKAENGYATIARLMLNLENPEQQKEIQTGLDSLRVALDQLAARGEG